MIFTLSNGKKVEKVIDGIGSGIDNILNPKETLSATINKIIEKIKNFPAPNFKNAIDAAKKGGEAIAENVIKGGSSVITDISDFLGFNDQSIGIIRKGMAKIAKETNKERANKNNDKIKTFIPKSEVDKSVNKYNELLQNIKNSDEDVSAAATAGMTEFLDNLQSTNDELSKYILNQREAAEAATAEGEEVEYEALSSDAVMDAQRDTIKTLFNDGSIRATIDQYRALGDTSGEVTDAQRVMIESIRDTDEGFADFLEQNPAATMGQYARAQVTATLKTMALEAATAALNSAITFGLSVAFQALLTWVTSLIHKYDDLREANMEVAEEYRDAAETYNEFKEKLEAAHKVLEDETSTDQELYDARSDLLNIQRDIIDAYGFQAQGIGNVNASLEEEIANLKEAARLEAIQKYNKISQESYEHDRQILDDVEQRFVSVWDNNTIRNQGELMGATNEEILANIAYADKIRELFKKYGYINTEDIYGNQSESLFGKYESAYDQKETLSKILDELPGMIPKSAWFYDEVYQEISDELTAYTSDKFQEIIDSVANTDEIHIATNAQWSDLRDRINESITDYHDKISSGDTAGAEEVLNTIEALKSEVDNLELTDSEEVLRDRFYDMFERVQADINKREFIAEIKTEFAPSFKRYKYGKTDEYFKQTFSGLTDIDLKNFDLIDSTDEQKEAYALLCEYADDYQLEVGAVIDVLVKEGILFSRNADAAKYTTTSYTSMLSSLEELTEKLETFDSAQQKILTGSSLTADEVNSLIKMYPQLIDSVERTTTGYSISADKLREARNAVIQSEKESILSDINESKRSLREQQKELDENQKIVDELSGKSDRTQEENRQLNNAKDIVKNRKKSIEDTNIQLKQQQFLLEQIVDPIEDWAAILDTVASKIQSISDKLIAMRSQMFKTGKVDPVDALNFIQEVPNWQDYIDIDSGGAVLKDLDDSQLTELIKKTSGYDSVLDGLNRTINANNVERNKQQEIIDKLEDKLAKNGHLVGDENSQLGLAKNKVAALDGEINNANETIDATETLLTSILEMLKGDVEVNAFNDLIDDLDHIKNMGGMNEDEYLANYKRRFAESRPALEESGSVDAMEAIENAEENIYSMELSQQQRYYDRELQQAENAYEDNLISFDEFQKRRMAINEKYYAPGTMLGNTEDGAKQYAANLRENAELGKDGFDKAITDLGRQKELGIISAEEYWAGYKQASEKYLKDVPSLSDEYADTQKELQTTAVTEMYDEELRELDNLHAMGIINDVEYYQKRKELYQTYLEGNAALDKEAEAERIELATTGQQEQYDYEMSILERRYENGEISLSEYLESCKALWEGYYKDQKQFANEDADTQKELLDKRKQGIQEQIDGLEAASDKETEPYEQQIDALEEIQDKYDDVMDERIEALEDQKKAIEKANDEQEKENDLLEKKRALDKASMRNRLVYAGGGRWEAKRDEEAYQDAKAEYEKALKEKEIDKLDEAIKALEDEKDSRDKAIEKQIKALEETVEKITAPFDNLIKVLTATIAENHNLDPEFIREILSSPTGQEALATYNNSLAGANKTAEKNGVKLTGHNEVTLDDVDEMVTKAAEENNKTADEIAEGLGLNYNKTAETKSDDINNNSTALNSSTKATEDNTSALNGLSQTAVNLKEFEKDMQAEYGLGNVDLTKRPFVSMPDGSTATVLSASEFVWQGDEENGKYVVVHYTPILPDGTILDDDTLNDYLYNTLENSENILDTDKNGLGIVLKVDTDFEISDEDVRSLETDKPTENIMNIIAACDEWDVALHEIQEDWVELKNLASETENAVDDDNIKVENNPTKQTNNKDDSADTSDMINNAADTETKSGSKVKPVTYSEWKKRHKLSEYAPHGKDIEDMTFEEYLNEKSKTRAEKHDKSSDRKSNHIIPLSEYDITKVTDNGLKELYKAVNVASTGVFGAMGSIANTGGIQLPDISELDIPVTTVAPQFNCTINIEGSADEKTVERMKNEINSALNEYTTELKASLHRSLINQRYKP